MKHQKSWQIIKGRLLKPESHPVESNYIKYNISDKIKGKIKNIRIALARLGETVTKNERKKIKKDLNEREKKQKPTKTQKNVHLDILLN